jgi:hypothetical protein
VRGENAGLANKDAAAISQSTKTPPNRAGEVCIEWKNDELRVCLFRKV